MRLNHVASFIANANHSMTGAAEKLGVSDCIADCVWFNVPEAIEWQHIGNSIDATFIFAWAHIVNVLRLGVMGRLWDCDDLGQGVIPVLT